ncbi:alkaline phosphatase PafA [Flavihumibacter sp. CACIAM 22H1]|uniref:alkaline phosphatase PafA n=1 Tax=Flavihumibacter sp. CACIAM 22H1 TaxID=1812911 RepID=UPI0007A87D21|nr:alkaline phosphatase PafA [Flavihumibacter sp. CACIAM 22H1]KYP16012.1 MAG: nucleotide pyrophosphatase [Flavihumibacter sp. CACIAM 22H1]
MKKFKYFSYLLLVLSTSKGFAQAVQEKLPRPKLVVGIVVDQMRYDYLYRYYDRYGNGGFKRMLKEGFSFENTYINYIPTYTAIGHTTIYTGSVPAIHGIAGNDWVTQATGEETYCTSDASVATVGASNSSGKMSPRNLLTSTITDELRLATNFKSKVISIALKDRSSILPGGHFANASYWYDGETGNFISSTFYLKELPAWVNQFNALRQPEQFLSKDWHTLYPISTYGQSIADNNEYENKFRGTDAPVMPVYTSRLMKENGLGLLRSTPYGNTVTLNFAMEAMKKEALGKNNTGATDFLAISLSSPDYIGHQFALNAIEIEDNYLRLDKDLANFFNYLDQAVGKGQYTVFLSADHGAAHNPQFLIDRKGSAGYFNSDAAEKGLNALLKARTGVDSLVISLANYQVHFNYKRIQEKSISEKELIELAVPYLQKLEGISFVTPMANAATAAIPQLLRERIINGYNYKRGGAIQFVLDPQLYSGGPRSKGTTHGNWHPYDSHIPLLFMGWGVKAGASNRVVHMTDIAPTVAALLHVQEPNGNIGQPLVELLNKR